MNRVAVARELAKVAKLLTADDEFTVKKKLKLKKEPGGTQVSLDNARAILNAGYGIEIATFTFDRVRADYRTDVMFWRDDETVWHTFFGFSAGYGGEGPRGMIEFLRMFGNAVDPEKVMSRLPEDRGKIDLLEDFK